MQGQELLDQAYVRLVTVVDPKKNRLSAISLDGGID